MNEPTTCDGQPLTDDERRILAVAMADHLAHGGPVPVVVRGTVSDLPGAAEWRQRRLERRFWLMVTAFVLSAVSCIAFIGAWSWFRGPAFLVLGFAWGVLAARLVEEA